MYFKEMINSRTLKVSKAIYGLLNAPKRRAKLTILSIFFTQDSDFHYSMGKLMRPYNALEISSDL